jgi:capsular polysaccharide biosynthesis protein
LDRQLASSRVEESRLRALIADYQMKVEAVPKRESELVELTRDYDILKKTYDSLLTKREDSKVAANLERRQIGEQFRILDPASLPVRPANQTRRLGMSFSGAGLGLIIGVLLTLFLEYRDSSFTRQDDVTRVLNLPVLAMVPVMISERDKAQRKRRRIAVDVAAVAVLITSVSILAVWGLR